MGMVTVKLPLSIAEILAGVEVEIEELAGRAGIPLLARPINVTLYVTLLCVGYKLIVA